MFIGKTLAIMQPYFFPYLGYFSLMHHADALILFDVVEYDRKGWMHRNRVLKPGGDDWQYIRAGVKKPPYKATIRDVRLVLDNSWIEQLFRQVEHYKLKAPFYEDTVNLLRESLAENPTSLTELNKNILEHIRDYIGIYCPIYVFSEMDIEIDKVQHPGQWALKICNKLNANTYVNPIGGRDIFRVDEFLEQGVNIMFVKNELSKYDQNNIRFQAGLSIIDVLMFNSIDETRKLVENYTLLTY